MRMFIAAGALALTLTATTDCKQPVVPTVLDVVQVVANDLAKGDSITDPQIASDVCQALGGTSTTDAVCASVDTLIQDAVALIIDTGVIKGQPVPANVMAAAKAYATRHPKAPAPASSAQ